MMQQRKYKEFNLTVLGEPVGQGRPRFSTRGGFVKAYDPKKSREEKQTIRALAIMQAQEMRWDMLGPEVPVTLNLSIYRSIPKSRPTWWKAAAKEELVSPVSRPDCDNILKGCVDACSGVVFHDDKQIYKINIESFYSETPRVEMTFRLEYVNIGEIKQELKARGKLAAVRTTKNGKSII